MLVIGVTPEKAQEVEEAIRKAAPECLVYPSLVVCCKSKEEELNVIVFAMAAGASSCTPS